MSQGSTMFLRAGTITTGRRLREAFHHNLRTAKSYASNVDTERSHLNKRLVGPDTTDATAQLVERLLADAGVQFRRKDAVRAVEFIFSLAPSSGVEPIPYFTKCVEWVVAYYGVPLLCADVHLDEAAPHCHVLLLPLRDGRLLGARMLGGRVELRTLRTKFWEEVAQPNGLKGTPPRLRGKLKDQLAYSVRRRLKEIDDAVLGSALWPSIDALITEDPRPWAEQLRVDVPPKKRRSSTDIFISKGKGPVREPDAPRDVYRAGA